MNTIISGIYNYCDYWCDRCVFTRRCRNFAMGEEMERDARGEKAGDDATRQVFWNRLAEQLREATIRGQAGEWVDDAAFEIIEMLSLLSRLQRGIHSALPGATSFVRPGFDEGPAPR